MDLCESHRFIHRDLLFQLPLLHRNGHMVDEQKSWNFLGLYSHTSTTCPLFTLSPKLTFTSATLPPMGVVISVSIFIASKTNSRSPFWMVSPPRTLDLTTMPDIGLLHTLLSSTGVPSEAGSTPAAPATEPTGIVAAAPCTMKVGNT